MSLRTDAELLKAWRGDRDEDAFRLLVERHGALVQATARRHLTQRDSAPDVAGKAFALLAQRGPSIPEGQVAGWLVRVTLHLCATENRTDRRRAARERRAIQERSHQETPMSPHAQDLAAELDRALLRLRPDERECLLLHFGEGLSHSEVGGRLGLSENAARMRVQRAIHRVRERMGLGTAAAFAQLKGLEARPLSATEHQGLLRLATTSRDVGGAGSIALKWILMTNAQKVAVGILPLTVLTVLTFGTGAAVAIRHGSPLTQVRSRLVAARLAGEYRGRLAYIVRSSGLRETMTTSASIGGGPDGLRLVIRYAEPTWGKDIRVSFEDGGRRMVVRENERQDVYRVVSSDADRVVGERFVDEVDRPFDQRVTLARIGREVVFRTQERLKGGEWAFASEYRWSRSSPRLGASS